MYNLFLVLTNFSCIVIVFQYLSVFLSHKVDVIWYKGSMQETEKETYAGNTQERCAL